MSVTCEQVLELLKTGGKAALDEQPEAQAHIGGCEACADFLIELEEQPPGLRWGMSVDVEILVES